MFLLSGAIILGPLIFPGKIDVVNSVDDFLQSQVRHAISHGIATLHAISSSPQYSELGRARIYTQFRLSRRTAGEGNGI
jgi:hypothetical protein